MNFSDFSDGGAPVSGDFLVGYRAGGGAGSDRRWNYSNISSQFTSINSQITDINTKFTGFNILDYGGDIASNDNSTALQDTINAAVLATTSGGSNGAVVTMPSARWQMRNGVTVPSNAGDNFVIDANGSSFFVQDRSLTTMFTFSGGSRFKNGTVFHFGTGALTNGVIIDGANAFILDNMVIDGEFGSITNCAVMNNTSNNLFFNCTIQSGTAFGIKGNDTANFTSIINGSLFGNAVAYFDTNPESLYCNGVVVSENTISGFKLAGAYSPTWLNCDIESTVGSAKSFDFTAAVKGGLIQNNFFAFQTDSVANMTSSKFIGNALFNNSFTFANSCVDMTIQDNFDVAASGSTVTVNAIPLLVSELPTGTGVAQGTRKFVSDATATTFNSIVAGTGGNHIGVTWDGTNWRIG